MSIGGITSYSLMRYEVKKTTRNASGKDFDNTALGGTRYIKQSANTMRQASVLDIYHSMGKFGGNVSRAVETKSILSQSHAMGSVAENAEYEIQMSSEIKGCYKIYDKQMNKCYTIDPARTSLQTDADTGKSYLVQTGFFGEFTNAIPVNQSLHSALKEFMGVEEIFSGRLNDKYVMRRDKFTGIEVMKVRGNEGSVSVIMNNGQENENRLQELADIYKEKYPNLIPSDESARAMAMLEVIGHASRTENGIMLVTSNGINYMDENDTSKSWAILYSMNDTDAYRDIMEAIKNSAIKGGIENASGWEDWFKKSGHDYERVLSDEELEQAAGQESETKTEIIVKPDGSRVLVMTMSVGGMETTMSLEISKPTKAPNETSRQDTDNHVSTAENNMVSDEMPDISKEA